MLRPAAAGIVIGHSSAGVGARGVIDVDTVFVNGTVGAGNFRRAGAERFILAGVIEDRAEIVRYLDALGSDGMLICRLVARAEVLSDRLSRRHETDPGALAWHRRRVGELTEILDAAAVDDLILDSSDTVASELARSVRRAAAWE